MSEEIDGLPELPSGSRDGLAAPATAALALDLQTLAEDILDLVEGLDGYGVQASAMSGVRLKDQPAWVAFYLAVRVGSRGVA